MPKSLTHYGIFGMHWGSRKGPDRKGIGRSRVLVDKYDATVSRIKGTKQRVDSSPVMSQKAKSSDSNHAGRKIVAGLLIGGLAIVAARAVGTHIEKKLYDKTLIKTFGMGAAEIKAVSRKMNRRETLNGINKALGLFGW